MPREVEGDRSGMSGYAESGGVDGTPKAVAVIVLTALAVLIALKMMGFRAMIGVNA